MVLYIQAPVNIFFYFTVTKISRESNKKANFYGVFASVCKRLVELYNYILSSDNNTQAPYYLKTPGQFPFSQKCNTKLGIYQFCIFSCDI